MGEKHENLFSFFNDDEEDCVQAISLNLTILIKIMFENFLFSLDIKLLTITIPFPRTAWTIRLSWARA